MTSTRYWWSLGKQCRRSSVRPAVTQRGETRDFGLKTSRLTLGLKFRSDKNISKWVAAPHPGRKMSPFVRCRAIWRLLRIRSSAGSIIDTLESSFQKGTPARPPRGFPFGRLSWWPRLAGDRYVISSAGVTPNEVSGKIRKDTGANPRTETRHLWPI